ncbi:hypothetical protein C1646_763452 [Rhizophagus diaphanus]|nr:hypothetical protein C1646_763452 [Rhizophagus diaphanus] [Rhizophagus sp. MUCL 43196]
MFYTILHQITFYSNILEETITFRFCWKNLRMCCIVSESRLSWIKSPHHLKIKIEPPIALITHEPQMMRTYDDRRVRENSGPWTILQNYIQDLLKSRDHVLYYHTPDLSSPEDLPECYYQLIVSDDL